MGLSKLIFFAMLAIGGYILYRKFIADAQKLVKRNEERRKEAVNSAAGTLVKDPVTGEYRVKKDTE